MATPPVTLKEAKRRIAAINVALRAGYRPPGIPGRGPAAVSRAAQAMGLNRETVNCQLPSIKRIYGLEPDWSLYKAEALPTADIPAPEPAAARQERRLIDQVERLTRELRDAQRQLNAEDDLRREIFKLADQPLDPPKWTLAPKQTKDAPSIPLLFTSDFQWGETIRFDDMAGINEYNIEIATRRYRTLIEKTVDLSFNHMTRPNYPGVVYARGGDAISGEIHDELARTNELSAVPAVHDLVKKEAWGIEQLAAKFGHVWVVSVPGNHGRPTVKSHAKRYAAMNYDTLSAWMLEQWFRGDGRVEFTTPMSGDALATIFGWRILITHGDRMGSRGGQGFIGPAATIARGMKKVVDYYATLGITIDVILVGHYHTALELEHGFSNGSLPGASEYARDGRMRPSPPKQWLLFLHPDHGVTARWPILLEKPMRRPGADVPVAVEAI